MGTWAIQAAAHAALTSGISVGGTRIRQRVGLMLTGMLGDDDEDSPVTDPESAPPASEADRPARVDDESSPALAPAAGKRNWPKPPPESRPYLDADSDGSGPDSRDTENQRPRHVPRHAAPPASFAAW